MIKKIIFRTGKIIGVLCYKEFVFGDVITEEIHSCGYNEAIKQEGGLEYVCCQYQ